MLDRDRVLKIMREIPQTKSNDNLLIAYFIKDKYGLQNTFDIALMTTANIYETVRRTRAKIQEEDPTMRPSDAVINTRMAKEQRVREEVRGL